MITAMNNPDIQTLLENARQKRGAGDFAGALDLATRAKALDPGDSEPHHIIGQCQRALGNPGESVKTFKMLVEHFPDGADLHAELGLSTFGTGEKEAGYQLAKKAVELDPNSQFSLEVLGVLASDHECWPKAIEAYEALIKMRPDHAAYYSQLCQAYNVSYRYEDAISAYHHFIRLNGRSAENLYQMGMFHFMARLFEEAVPWFEKAARADPENEEPVFYQARCHIQFGDLKTGEALAKKALKIKPASIHTLTLLNELRPDVISEENIKELKILLEKDNFDGALERALTHLFLGKYHHRAGDYDAAFAQFKACNEDRYRAFAEEGMVYNPALMAGNFAETKRIFSKEGMAKMAGGGSKSEAPILIVSMPRSGTTLLEQIIASHSQVHGAGELNAMSRIFFDLNYKINEALDRPIEDIIKENAADWADIYLGELKVPEGMLRGTDKMPVNFIHLGIFQAMFPNARVIYIKRNPLDTCLSMYSNNLSGSYAYTAKFEDLGHYFNLHCDLMRHWKENLSMKYMELSYAELVEEPEKKARQVMEFCGLEFEDKVLEFYKGRKSAYTISQVQVSQPINKKGLARWRPYKKHIGPLIEALDEDIVGPLGVDKK